MKNFIEITDFTTYELTQILNRAYRITSDILEQMNDDGLFLPCPPVTRGQEVSEKSIISEKCKDYDAKEYLLHSQNAIMKFLTKATQ